MPKLIESIVIGRIHGSVAHAWIERDGALLRYFQDMATTVYSPALGRDIGLTIAVEIRAREYHHLFHIFGAESAEYH